MLLKGMEFDTTHFITDVSGKYPRLWALKGAHPVTVNRWYKFGALTSICTIAPSFREISELPDWHNLDRCGKIKEDDPSTKEKQACGVSWFCHHPEKQTTTPNAEPATQEIRPLHLTAGLEMTRMALSPLPI
ncbi:hypothetical protein ACS0TY_009625 [Phlomoides rotata]